MHRILNRGVWTRPTDKMAVYTEIDDGETWGIRVTLLGSDARVEAIDGPKCSHYGAPPRLFAVVKPPNILEKFKGITFKDKLMKEVETKRRVAEEENRRIRVQASKSDYKR